MIRITILGFIVAVVFTAVYGVITLYDNSLQVGRMWETPAVRPHQAPMPVMSKGVVPRKSAEIIYRSTNVKDLKPALDLKASNVIAEGETAYTNFCIHCHGLYHDGNGTVGQSFVPPPGDLRGVKVQTELSPAKLFHEISYGIVNGRQPPLATTVSMTDRWRVIAYVKSLGLRK
jgi:mono/diheme cytochrome c family protein